MLYTKKGIADEVLNNNLIASIKSVILGEIDNTRREINYYETYEQDVEMAEKLANKIKNLGEELDLLSNLGDNYDLYLIGVKTGEVQLYGIRKGDNGIEEYTKYDNRDLTLDNFREMSCDVIMSLIPELEVSPYVIQVAANENNIVVTDNIEFYILTD